MGGLEAKMQVEVRRGSGYHVDASKRGNHTTGGGIDGEFVYGFAVRLMYQDILRAGASHDLVWPSKMPRTAT